MAIPPELVRSVMEFDVFTPLQFNVPKLFTFPLALIADTVSKPPLYRFPPQPIFPLALITMALTVPVVIIPVLLTIPLHVTVKALIV